MISFPIIFDVFNVALPFRAISFSLVKATSLQQQHRESQHHIHVNGQAERDREKKLLDRKVFISDYYYLSSNHFFQHVPFPFSCMSEKCIARMLLGILIPRRLNELLHSARYALRVAFMQRPDCVKQTTKMPSSTRNSKSNK